MEEQLRLQMVDLLMSGMLAQAVAVVAELGVADQLVDGPKSAAEMAPALGVQPDKLHRLLRYTASYGVFRDTGKGQFELTPLAAVLRSDAEHSVRASGRMVQRTSRAYAHMLDNVRTGKCAYEYAFGKNIFADLAEHPADAAIFDAAMSGFHGGETEAALDAYALADVGTICDIGCGSGLMMAATLTRYPAMQGILMDLPHVMERTRGTMEAAGVAPRCKYVPGSFFETAPTGADAYTLRHIIHDWMDEDCVRILEQVRRVIQPGGKLLLLEAVVPEGNEPHFAKMADMAMMLWPNGTERTAEEYRRLLERAGFELTSITPTRSAVSVMEARPRG